MYRIIECISQILFRQSLYCTVLYCTVLYCNVLYFTVLYCTVLCCAVQYCTVLCCAVLCCAVLYCTVLYCTVLCCAVLCCTVLYCAVLCCAVLLPPGVNPIAVNKYVNININITYVIPPAPTQPALQRFYCSWKLWSRNKELCFKEEGLIKLETSRVHNIRAAEGALLAFSTFLISLKFKKRCKHTTTSMEGKT